MPNKIKLKKIDFWDKLKKNIYSLSRLDIVEKDGMEYKITSSASGNLVVLEEIGKVKPKEEYKELEKVTKTENNEWVKTK